jgi:hypothetical protein
LAHKHHEKVTLAGKRVCGAHYLLEICPDGADNMIAIAVGVDLADVINCCMQLIRSARA